MSSTAYTRLRARPRTWPSLLAGALVGLLLWACWIPEPDAAAGALVETAPPAPPGPTAAIRRTALPAPTPPGFGEMFEEMVELGLAATRHRELANPEAAARCEADGAQLYRRALRLTRDADLQALRLRREIPAEDHSPAAALRRGLCRQFLVDGLRMLEEARQRGDGEAALRQRLQVLLATMPEDPQLAGLVAELLLGQGLLGMAEEPLLQSLLDLSRQRSFLILPTGSLLLELWRNLLATGVLSRAEVCAQALGYLQRDCRARCLAACRLLLQTGEAKYQAAVLETLRNRRDPAVLEPLFVDLATHAPVGQTLDFISGCGPLPERSATVPLLQLARRDPAPLAGRYRELREGGLRGDLRAELVTACGFHGGEAGQRLAVEALHQDPDPVVRQRAVLALSASASPTTAATEILGAIRRVDPATDLDGEASQWLSVLVLAAENLLRGPDLGPARAVAVALSGHPALRTADRRRLQGILTRTGQDPETARRAAQSEGR